MPAVALPPPERLYEVFGRVPRPERVPGCPHCVGAGEDACLLAVPLARLEPEALARYAAKALSTWGGVAEFRYFLPRLLECAAVDAFSYPDPEIVFGKLATAGWTAWPPEERAAVEDFLTGWWDTTLTTHPARPPIDTVLCSLAATGLGLTPFLARWEALDGEAAIRHLRDFAEDGPSSAFWDRRGTAYAEVRAWLTGGRAGRAVEAAFSRVEDDTRAALLTGVDALIRASEPPGGWARTGEAQTRSAVAPRSGGPSPAR
ncbi:hypothetical protein OIE66_20795 [Nonomuraea sp. NBC_01738]|uniref:hypothetical protein n=1 Tax=Nonomuraea sp. NBC_01738 TaxID=2976003 RepID=UPI002E0EB24D|nr:hypothetical protein OIE66_20795 [Nonomuraea sp. NBC_01738]